MKKIIVMLALVFSFSVAHSAPGGFNWGSNAEASYRAAQAVVYDNTPQSGDAAHVAAGNALLAGTGVDFLTLAAYRDMFGSDFTSSMTMGAIFYFAYGPY